MHRSIKRILALALATVSVAIPAMALAQGDVTVALTANRVIARDGKESLASAEQVKPGDVIEYRAIYRNQGASGVQKLTATLPVPAGMEYLSRTAQPAAPLASLDGRTFEPVPLKRRVRLADGHEVMREIPASEYRFLRWTLGTLGIRAEQTVRARMRVSAPAPMAAVAPGR
jgi:uncharacterized repeat protein (TIGR01451 family)